MAFDNKTPVIENRKARHEYFILDTLECGIALRGNEVKSIRAGRVSLKEAWVSVENGELILHQCHITPWETANSFDVDAKRDIKLLAHSREINKLYNSVRLDGYTLIPLKMYFVRGKCKVNIGVCKGKHLYDKRQAAKDKQAKLDMSRKTLEW